MSSIAFNSFVSGIQAAAVTVQSIANNVANANTDGYQVQSVDLVQSEIGVEARLEVIEAPDRTDLASHSERAITPSRLSNVNLINENVNLLESQNFFQANLRGLKAADEMTGTFLDTSA